jgi:hypothetical protein
MYQQASTHSKNGKIWGTTRIDKKQQDQLQAAVSVPSSSTPLVYVEISEDKATAMPDKIRL